MSYLQIEIEGVKRGLKFNQMTLVIMSEYTDAKNEVASSPYALFYAALYANCYVKREEPDFDFEKACDWFDKLEKENIESLTKAFNESISFQKDLPKEKKSKVKKTTGTSV